MSVFLGTLGRRLKAERNQTGLSQTQLAQRAGISRRFLAQMEAGQANISVQRLADVCGALSLPMERLFHGLGHRRSTLALVGLRGAGKSTTGARVAARQGARFIELDELIEQEARMSLSEIFEFRGAAYFRALELQVLEEVLSRPERQVLAVGGSLVTFETAWRKLRESAQTVWLHASPASHLKRVTKQGDLRPMKGWPNALEALTEILEVRAPLYEMAHHKIDTDAHKVEGTVDAVVGCW